MRRAAIVTLVVGVVGAVLILLGGLLGWVAFPAVVESTVADTVAVKIGSDAYDRWTELPLPMQFKVRIFDVQNPQEITDGEAPIYIERGPYVYTETRKKESIMYNEEDDRATYKQRSWFHFDANASVGDEMDFVTVPNIPLISFAQITESIGPLSGSISTFNKAVDNLFDNQIGIFTTVTVHDYLFGGLPMNCTSTLGEEVDPEFLNEYIMCTAYAMVAPKTVTIGEMDGINHFSFFGYKNATTDGLYEVGLGIKEVEDIGRVFSWDGQTATDKWGDESCNAIQGTDSTIFRPKLDDVDEIYIFNTDICRSVKLTYKEDTEYKGLSGRRYVANKDVFASVVNNKKNYCFCPQSVNNLTSRGGCLLDGVLELSSCQGAPVILSHPYYLFGDELYKNYNPSLNASEDKHQIYLDLEPYTGSPLRGASRIQMNVNLKRIPEVDMMKNFNNNLLPVLWIEEGVELSDDLIDMLNDELFNILDALNIIRWVLIGLGIAALCGATAYYVIKLR